MKWRRSKAVKWWRAETARRDVLAIEHLHKVSSESFFILFFIKNADMQTVNLGSLRF